MNAKIGVPARRKRLQNLAIDNTTHPGLALQRYLAGHKPKERDNQQPMPEDMLLDAVSALGASEVYKAAFHRWRRFATAQPSDRARVSFTLTAASPIAIGLGNASPLEVGLTLHHTYGMPIIPGSALKGLCRRGALQLVNEGKLEQKNFEYLFGTGGDKNAAAGAVVFYDAWYVPDSLGGKLFHRDVITVHHPEYYGSRGTKPPTDFDDPTPVPFLVVKPGVQFLFVLDAITLEWAQFTEKLLRWCLASLGVGAKTNAGYGYFAQINSGAQASPTQQPNVFQAETILWENVTLVYEPGPKRLKATHEGKTAQAEGIGTENLLKSLAPNISEKLRDKKRLVVDLQVRQQGNWFQIMAIIPKS
jgi:CRISPR-associated protein Cmr6